MPDARVERADHGVLLATRASCTRLETSASLTATCRFVYLSRCEIQVMTQGRGAWWLGMTTGEFFRIVAGENMAASIAHFPVMHKLHADSTDRLWIGTAQGVATVST